VGELKMKRLLIIIIVLCCQFVANADLTLTINGLDTSKPIEVKGNSNIIIGVAGQTNEQKESYFVTCEMGGILKPFTEPNALAEIPVLDQYLFTFKDEELDWALVNLTVGDVLDYQLILFNAPDANTIIFGIDSDTIKIPEQEPELEQHIEYDEPKTHKEDPNRYLAQIITRNIYEPPIYITCPNESNPHRLVEVSDPVIDGKEGQSSMGTDSYVELQEITDSMYLDPDEVYYVPYPPLLIHGVGEEIDVIIPSGTTIILAEDWNYGIVVYDGANVHFGEPAPKADEPDPIYEPDDVNSPVPPVWLVGESGNPFFNNFCGIFIDRTAGMRCKLDNICLRGFYYGIQIDQQLEYPISNINIFGCWHGILSFGANRIINSCVSFYGLWSPEYPYDGYAYEFIPESYDGSIIFEGADFEIVNCLADDGDYGFTANGLYEPHEAPVFYSRDCAATNCYSAFNGWNGNFWFSIICPGLYNNVQNENDPELTFTDPVYEVNDPFVFDPSDYRIFLNSNSQFVDSGSSLSACPGWTTSIDGDPDKGIGDIWPHYQIRGVDKWLKADLNIDNAIDMNDLADFADQWLVTIPNSADLNNDQKVNFLDFAILANQWLFKEITIEIFDPETMQTVEPNNIQGYVGIGLKYIPLYAGTVSVYVDNQLTGSLSLGWDKEEQWIELQSNDFSNGWHTLRLVTTDLYGGIINHRPINVYFNNLLYKVADSDYFHPDEDYKYSGFYDGDNTLEAKVTDKDGQTLWSNNYNGQHISIVIPGATFGTEQFCEFSITETGGGEESGSSSTVTKKDLTKKFKQADYPDGVRMVIVLPNKDVFKIRKPAIIECAEACNNRNVTWVALYHRDVTEENLTYLYKKIRCRYIYWCGHAGSRVQNVQRTHTECWELKKGWIWDSWKKRGVFSWTRQTLDDTPLPDDWDTRGFDLWSLEMHESWNKKIVFIDGCFSAEEFDMAKAYGMDSLPGQGSKDQIYIGWRVKVLTVPTGHILDPILFSTGGVKLFWNRMGRGDSVDDALYYTSVYGEGGIAETLWGPNCMLDIGDVYGDDNIFVWGNGFVNLDEIGLDP
jgi:hypothetical protein